MMGERVKVALAKLADWFDDRWTWAAIGLLTGYFGFGTADAVEWQAFQEVGIAVASLILILVKDKRRVPSETPPPDEPKVPSVPASTPRTVRVLDSGAPTRSGGVPNVPSRRSSNTREAAESPQPHGYGDRD